MPDRDLPGWARWIGRFLWFGAYGLALTIAAGDAFVPSVTITSSADPTQTIIMAIAMAVAAAVSIVGLALHRWRIEWVPTTILFFLLLSRSLLTWITVGDSPTRLSAAAGMTLGAFAILARALNLWVFASKTGAVARRAERKLS